MRISHVRCAVPLVLALHSCGPSEGAAAPCCQELAAETPLPGTSLYHWESSWRDQDGSEHRLRDFHGGPVVMAMVFTHCAYACPRILADLRSIDAKLIGAERVDTRFLLVTMDPDRDTPEVLRNYARDNDLDTERWTLLHGASADVQELAVTLGMKIKPIAGGDFSHSNIITVLDADGVIAHQQRGLNVDIDPTLECVTQLEAN